MKILSGLALAALAAVSLAACSSDADVASANISQAADKFEVPRRVVLYNGITNEYIQTVEGYCSLQPSSLGDVAVVCKTDTGFVKHIWKLGDNVTVFSEQLTGIQVSTSFYRVTFKPSAILPSIDLR